MSQLACYHDMFTLGKATVTAIIILSIDSPSQKAGFIVDNNRKTSQQEILFIFCTLRLLLDGFTFLPILSFCLKLDHMKSQVRQLHMYKHHKVNSVKYYSVNAALNSDMCSCHAMIYKFQYTYIYLETIENKLKLRTSSCFIYIVR